MKKLIVLLIAGLVFTSCKKEESKTETETKAVKIEKKVEKKTEKKVEKSPVVGSKAFAVVWKWATKDVALVTKNSATIAEELRALSTKGVVENIYYDPSAKTNKLENFPNITFFIKSESIQTAAATLDELTIVKKNISKYSLHPVGSKWLGRKDGPPSASSFVAIWTTAQGAKPTKEQVRVQTGAVMKLFKAGDIENVYFDIPGTTKSNDVFDFVFFVNAKNEAEAKAVCDGLPFAKEKIATYKMHSVGVHWMK